MRRGDRSRNKRERGSFLVGTLQGQDATKTFGQWNTQRFALVGALIGIGYGLAMASLVGIVSVRSLDVLIWALIFSASSGAAIGAGLAVLCNMLAFYIAPSPAPSTFSRMRVAD